MQTDVKCTTFDEHDPVPEDVPLLVDPSVWGLTLVDRGSIIISIACRWVWRPLLAATNPRPPTFSRIEPPYLRRLDGMGLGRSAQDTCAFSD